MRRHSQPPLAARRQPRHLNLPTGQKLRQKQYRPPLTHTETRRDKFTQKFYGKSHFIYMRWIFRRERWFRWGIDGEPRFHAQYAKRCKRPMTSFIWPGVTAWSTVSFLNAWPLAAMLHFTLFRFRFLKSIQKAFQCTYMPSPVRRHA